MGVRSDAFVCIKNLAHDEMPERIKKMLKGGYGASVRLHPDGTAYVIEDVKWYVHEHQELRDLYAYLGSIPDEEYLVIAACHDYPDSTEGDKGGWLDNPWGARRVTTVRIEFDALAY
jgi:hypothetical protein